MVAIPFLSRARQRAFDGAEETVRTNERELKYDLFTQISYMASLATAKVSRDILFTRAASLNLSSTPYFKEINTLVNRLSYDYAEACRAVSERVKDHEVSTLLKRMAGSLNSGEDEAEFLTREAAVLAELYVAEYERDVESLRKWTDAYSALIVSAGLIVVVSIISLMIYSLGLGIVLGTVGITITLCLGGAWVIYASVPREGFTRAAGLSSGLQLRAVFLLRAVVPVGIAAGVLTWALGMSTGVAFIAIGLSLLPAGWTMQRDARRLARQDSDIANTVRLLGGVTSAIGTTVRDAIGKIDRRSLASLEQDVRRLEIRMNAGISPNACWRRFVKETGSELIERTVRIFWDALTLGGEAGRTGKNAAFFASRIAIIREKRGLVSGMFGYLVWPMHASMVGLMIFIVTIMDLFATSLANAAPPLEGGRGGVPSAAVMAGFNSFAGVDFDLLKALIMAVVVALTAGNALAPWLAAGGHRLRLAFYLGITMILTGVMVAFLPGMAQSIFNTITAHPA
ncbi:MAG: archaellar assembly protein FlaJ [Gemmatimonadetes bacterium]|nr:archaellar assembly protein FlaJ [Gemmatimonadota bacterium]